MLFIALMPRGAEACAPLSDLDTASSFRLEAELPAVLGLHRQAADAQEASILLVGPGYENGVFATPAGIGAVELSADLVRGAFQVTVPDDPIEIFACAEDVAPTGGVTLQCSCHSHAGVKTACHVEGCCYAAPEGSFEIGMPFEAAPCPSLCEGLQKRGYECLP